MGIFEILQKRSKFFYLLLVLLSLSNGLWSGALLLVVNNTINKVPIPYFPNHGYLIFLCLIVVSFMATKYFQLYMIGLTANISYELEMSIVKKIRFAAFEAFKKIGNEKVYTIIQDAQTVSTSPEYVLQLINSLVTVLIGMVYMFLISPLGTVLILLVITFLAFTYYFRNKQIGKDLASLREMSDTHYRSLSDLLLGFREIKMSSTKSNNLVNKFIDTNRAQYRDLHSSVLARYLNNDLSGSYSWYLIIGFIVFALPAMLTLDFGQITTFLVTLLYLMGPIGILISILPSYSRMKVSYDRLKAFEKQVETAAEVKAAQHEGVPGGMPDTGQFEELHLHNVHYEYFDEKKNEVFSLKDINFTITRGEVVIITGGNGSGKSTFINILAGLYRPSSGVLCLNGVPVNTSNYPDYRDRISAVFSDHYLFKENYENYELLSSNHLLKHYIQLMWMESIAQIDEGRNRISIDLSKGQQKRLALIHALLENKDLLILDEWAAEQDPQFRSYFYETILPELKRMGKTIVAVTHDDAYFRCAERIIKFDCGTIVYDKSMLLVN
jgi:cyclic peptide transporter